MTLCDGVVQAVLRLERAIEGLRRGLTAAQLGSIINSIAGQLSTWHQTVKQNTGWGLYGGQPNIVSISNQLQELLAERTHQTKNQTEPNSRKSEPRTSCGDRAAEEATHGQPKRKFLACRLHVLWSPDATERTDHYQGGGVI